MFNKKRIIWLIVGVAISGFVVCGGIGIFDYFEYRNVVNATGGMPWQDAGTVSMYQPVCVSTPPDGVCKNCLMCGPVTGNYICASYSEIQFTGQLGGMKVCPLQGFVYKGGGTMPMVGQGMIVGGVSDIMPYVIGVPSVSASRIQKLVDAFNYIIAGFKD